MTNPDAAPTRTQNQTIGAMELTFVTNPTLPEVTITGGIPGGAPIAQTVLNRANPTAKVGSSASTIITTAALALDPDTLVLSYSQETSIGPAVFPGSGSFQL